MGAWFNLFDGKERQPADVIIHVDGHPIGELHALLLEATVEVAREEAASATLVFATRRDERGHWTVQDAGLFRPWAAITLTAAFGHRKEEVMRGYVREVSLDTPEDAGAARLMVTCQDESIRLDREQHRRSWGSDTVQTSDLEILAEILRPYGLAPDPACATGQVGLVDLAQNDTDIQFLKARAEYNGYELIFRADTVYFGPMRLQAAAQDTLLVYAGNASNCLSLNVRSDGHQPDAVAYDAAAADGDAVTTATVAPDLPLLGTRRADSSDAGLEPFTWKLSAEPGADPQRLQALAQMKANALDMQRLQGEGELDGTRYGHVLQVGLPLPVDGLGAQLSGVYYVDSVSHSFTQQGYRQRFRLLRNAWGDNLGSLPVPAAASALQGVL